MRFFVLLALAAASCARPLPIARQQWMLEEVASRYHSFFDDKHDPDPAHDVGVMRPRFGLPAIAQTGAAFELALLERGGPQTIRAALIAHALTDEQAAACLNGASLPGSLIEGCWPLALDAPVRDAVERGVAVARVTAHTASAPPAGGYDLYVESPVDAPARLPRAVWLRSDDPGALAAVQVAQLSDLHVGKGRSKQQSEIHQHLERVIADVNELRPDVVLITGDVFQNGNNERLPAEALKLLESVEAPILAILGNHDHGFDSQAFTARHYGPGWEAFARAFHPYLHFEVTLGGWDFVGFDSGPSEFSPLVLTRGLLPETVAELHADVERSFVAHHRGVVLFSHAPTRALYGGSKPTDKRGVVGKMLYGATAFERVLLDAASRGQRVLHLAGHTHWNDVFESKVDPKHGLEFVRWDHARLGAEPQEVTGKACLITTQSCSHTTYPRKDNGKGYGFAWLTLGDQDPILNFHRYAAAP
jgi:hypothetical protein